MCRHLATVAFLGAAAAAQSPAAGTSYEFLLPSPTPAQLQQLEQQFGCDADCSTPSPGGDLDVIVGPESGPRFARTFPAARLIARGRPFAAILAELLATGPDVPDPLYFTVDEIEQEIDAQVAQYPGLASKVDLSALPGGTRTYGNRALFALKVSDNVASDEDEPAIVLAAQHHARELNSPYMVIGAMRRILAAYATDPLVRAVVDGYELYFVPMVNPDGVAHVWNVDNFWRKNRRVNGDGSFGVDLNRNYPFLWNQCGGALTPGSDTYRGPAPASEPEVVTMRNLIARLRPEIYLDFHSSGREVLRLYAPCAVLGTTLDAFQQHYLDDLRTPMNYAFRNPSAAGEAPHDHWATGGTLAYLTEIDASFQPAFTNTVAEEARVWPGIQRALLTWRPALRGHVRSSTLQPLPATISFAPGIFTNGEQQVARARDGRYGLWLPLGTWLVTFAAPGYQSRTTSVTVAAYDQPLDLEVLLDALGPAPTITKAGSERIGTTVTLTYTSPGDAGRGCFIGWSFGTTPGIHIGGLRVVPLNDDFLLHMALDGNPVLAPTWGQLDASGQLQSFLHIPGDPVFAGLTCYMAGVTLDPAYDFAVKSWSQPVAVTTTL